MAFLAAAAPYLAATAASVAGAAASKYLPGGKKEKKEKYEQRSKLAPGQIPLYNQLEAANMGPGAGGSFGAAADYHRGILNDESNTMEQMAAPEIRRFNEDIMPGIAEQYAGMGSGGLSSSGFQNAATQGATDLSERLGSIRANLRAQSAQGLTNIGQIGLQDYTNNIYQPSQPGEGGVLEGAAPGIASGLMSGMNDYFQSKSAPRTPTASALPAFNTSSMKQPISNKGTSGPYGLPNFGV